MYASDFLFNGQSADSLGLIICSFDRDVQTASGGEIEFHTEKVPGADRFAFYGALFNTVLAWNFSIMKNPDRTLPEDLYFTRHEESAIARWLLQTDGYHWFQFLQEGYEDICYKACVNMAPHQVLGRTVGFDLSVVSDCAYGYTPVICKTETIDAQQPLTLQVQSDIDTYILPRITISAAGDFQLWNRNDTEQRHPSKLTGVSDEIFMDSENGIINGLSSPKDFNWYFLRLINGENQIETDSETGVQLQISYREPRRVIV